MYEWYDESKHYEAIIKSRRYPPEQKNSLLDKAPKIENIREFIKVILRAENQTLTDDKIISLVDKYNKTRGQIYKAYNEENK